MSIDKLGAQGAARTYVQNADAIRAAGARGTGRAGQHHHSAQDADSVTLSSDARSLAAATDAVQQAPDVRDQKVSEIKQRVDSGTYEVPARVLARQMLNASNPQP
jgi:negative regulator of flagellin synthesis FlgM